MAPGPTPSSGEADPNEIHGTHKTLEIRADWDPLVELQAAPHTKSLNDVFSHVFEILQYQFWPGIGHVDADRTVLGTQIGPMLVL